MAKINLGNNSSFIENLFIFMACFSVLIQAFAVYQNVYSILKYILYLLIILIICNLIINKRFKINDKFIYFMIIIFYLNILVGLLYSLFFNEMIIADTLIIPLILIIIGYNLEFSVKIFKKLIYFYSCLTLIIGWYVIFTYGNGFSIANEYFFPQKNQLGAIIGVSIFMQIYAFANRKKISNSLFLNFFSILIIIMNIIPLLLLRNRTTMVALVIILILLFIKSFISIKLNNFPKFILVIILLALVFSSENIMGFFYDSFFLNYDTSNLNGLSANRFDVYLFSLDFIKDNWLFGEFLKESELFDPHNFLLYNILKNGIILSLGLFIIYFYLLLKVLRSWLLRSISNIHLTDYLLILAMTASVFEYQQPYGPGTTQLLLWFFIGNEIRERSKSGKEN